jgi:hypothetical protein
MLLCEWTSQASKQTPGRSADGGPPANALPQEAFAAHHGRRTARMRPAPDHRVHPIALGLAFGLAACAGRAASRAAGSPPSTPRESDACHRGRIEILADVQRSQQRACTDDADCAAVTNPGHPSPELYLVAHALDRETLNRRAAEHIDACGAYYEHRANNAVRVVTPACADHHCTERETTLHIED